MLQASKLFNRKEWLLLFSMAFIQFSHIVDFMILMPLGPQLMRIFNISPEQFGMLVSAYTFSAAAAGFAASFFTDRFDRKKILLFFYVGFCISTIACALSETYSALLGARILSGAFGGVLSSLTLVIVGDSIHHSKRSTAMGIVMTAFSAASIFGVPFSLWLAAVRDWHAPFMFLGVLSLLLIGMIMVSVPKMNSHISGRVLHQTPWGHVTMILKNKNQTLAIAFMMALVAGQFSVIPFFSPTLVANAGLAESDLFKIYFVGGVCSIIAGPLIGRLSDVFGNKRVFTIGALISIIPFILITHLGSTPLLLILILVAFFFVAMSARIVPAQSLVTSTVRPQNRGSFLGIMSSSSSLAMAAASYFSGLIITKSPEGRLDHYEIVGIVAVAFSLLALVLIRYIRPIEGEDR